MKTRYLLFFPAGLDGLVVAQLAKDLRNVAIDFHDDSACVISSTSDPGHVAGLGYVKNAFIVQTSVSADSITGAAKSFEDWLRRGGKVSLGRGRRPRGFRVMAHVNGALQAMPSRARQGFEQSISRVTRTAVQPRGDGDEYWLVERRDSPVTYLAWRIPRRRRRQPAQGSLSPELSHLLIMASDPMGTDVFLDPFAGSGALPLARSQWPAKAIIASDVAKASGLLTRRVTAFQQDFFDESAYGDFTANVIVTDPPWGEHAGSEDGFLDALAQRFKALLCDRRDARLVVLITRSLAATLASALRYAGFTEVRSTDILVNGHPASVLKALVRPG